MLHVVDLDGAFGDAESLNRVVARRIIDSVGIPVQFGGGMRTINDIETMITAGASRIVIGTLAAESPETLASLIASYGSRIVVGIDCRDGQVMTRGWETHGELQAVELGRRIADLGVERIVFTDVARDGMLAGPNVEQTCLIARETGLKVTASGGISSLEDIDRLVRVSDCGIDSLIVGKALYEGRFTLKDALVHLRN